MSYLDISMNDQLAAGVLWHELARRAARGKVTLWENLRDHAGLAARLPDIDFDALIDRARQQRDRLKPHHDAAGATAFGGLPAADA
jgi:hypothetical protein